MNSDATRDDTQPAAISGREEMRMNLLVQREALRDRVRHEKVLVDRVGRWLRAVKARRLAGYWPTRGEPDLTPMLAEWAHEDPQRVVALPLIEGDHLVFVQWVPGEAMVSGAYGIPIPASAAQSNTRIAPQLLLVPCVGIDRRRYRLGYGAGYYDRTLPQLVPKPVAVGIAFDCGKVESIDPMPHDFRLDLAITESGVW